MDSLQVRCQQLAKLGRDQREQLRPSNSSSTYASGTRKWSEWCRQEGFQDGDLVSEQKAVLFAHYSAQEAKHARADRPVMFKTVESRLSAVDDLRKRQVADGRQAAGACRPLGQVEAVQDWVRVKRLQEQHQTLEHGNLTAHLQ